jgi:hypothetical protein
MAERKGKQPIKTAWRKADLFEFACNSFRSILFAAHKVKGGTIPCYCNDFNIIL